jgi:hypothetical protein
LFAAVYWNDIFITPVNRVFFLLFFAAFKH